MYFLIIAQLETVSKGGNKAVAVRRDHLLVTKKTPNHPNNQKEKGISVISRVVSPWESGDGRRGWSGEAGHPRPRWAEASAAGPPLAGGGRWLPAGGPRPGGAMSWQGPENLRRGQRQHLLSLKGFLEQACGLPRRRSPLPPRVTRNKQPAAVLVCKACASIFPLLMYVNSQASASWPPGWTKPGGLSQNTVQTSERRSKMEMNFELLTIF